MLKFIAKICETCHQKNQEIIDKIFSEHYKVRSWHSCEICKEKTHWEFSNEYESEQEFKEAEQKYQSLID